MQRFHIKELSIYLVATRLARLINQLPTEQLEGPKESRLTQDALAARLGTVHEVVVRSSRELQRSGALRVDRGQIQVIDHKRLLEWT